MEYLIGTLVGGTIGMLVLSRIMLWAFKKLGDNGVRLTAAHAASYVIVIAIAGLSDGGPDGYSNALGAYTIPALIVVAIDVFRLRARRRKERPQTVAEQPLASAVEQLREPTVEQLSEDELIIRRARDAFDTALEERTAEYRTKKAALSTDEAKIRKATEYVETSRLSLALPFVQDEVAHWPSWTKLDVSRWTPPMALSDVEGERSREDGDWVQFRAEDGPLYRIVLKPSSMPNDGDFNYASMTLFVEGEEVLGMWVKQNWTKEYDRWHFAVVEALKVGPWIEGFMDFYIRLRAIKESLSDDRSNAYIQKKAAKIDLGGVPD